MNTSVVRALTWRIADDADEKVFRNRSLIAWLSFASIFLALCVIILPVPLFYVGASVAAAVPFAGIGRVPKDVRMRVLFGRLTPLLFVMVVIAIVATFCIVAWTVRFFVGPASSSGELVPQAIPFLAFSFATILSALLGSVRMFPIAGIGNGFRFRPKFHVDWPLLVGGTILGLGFETIRASTRSLLAPVGGYALGAACAAYILVLPK